MEFKALASSLFGDLADKFSGTLIITKNSLLAASIRMPFRVYLSVLFLASVLAFVGIFITLLVLFILPLFKIADILKVELIIFVPAAAAIVTFGVGIIYPSQIATSRRRNMETNLPFVLTHMGAIAQSGVPPYLIFKLVSEFDEYGEIAKEMRKIVKNVDEFGVDPLTAVKEVAGKTPSDSLKQILMGFVTTVESGGDIKLYLRSAGQQSLFEWRTKRERFLQQLSAYAEFYTGLLIAAPLFIISLFAVMNMIQPNIAGYNILDLTKLSIYLLIPALNIGFLIFLRGVEVEI